MLKKLTGDVFISRSGLRQLKSNRQHRGAIKSHPCWTASLVQGHSIGHFNRAIKYTNVVQREEAATEEVVTFPIVAIDPPGEIKQQFLESALQKIDVFYSTVPPCVDQINVHHCPGMHRWVYVSKRELVGRHLAVWMHIPFAQEN